MAADRLNVLQHDCYKDDDQQQPSCPCLPSDTLDTLDALGLGAVAKAVGNRVQRLRRDDGSASGGEVNHALGRRLTQGLPAIDLAHADLA